MRIAADKKVFMPRSINDALAVLRRRPGALVFAGGTEFQTLSPGEALINQDILSLANIEELKRIYRSDRTLEVGSMVTLERLSRFSREIIPAGFVQAVLTIPHAPLRGVATIGGNLLAHPRYFSTWHYLNQVDARVELRRSGGSRWISVARLRDGENNPQLHQELLTKIRIPVHVWSHQQFRRFYSRERDLTYGICALASVHRGIIEDLRIAFLFSGLIVFQLRNADSMLIGRRTPVATREIGNYLEEITENWQKHESWNMGDDLVHSRLINLSASFIHSLSKS